MPTPEGKVKAEVKKVLAKYKSDLDDFWPVPSGYGESHLDCIMCFHGQFIAIETKAPGKKLTKLQRGRVGAVRRAGGLAIVIGGDDQTHTPEELDVLLQRIKMISTIERGTDGRGTI